MERGRSYRSIGAVLLLSVVCGVGSSQALAAKPSMPHHRQMVALYVIDHRGGNPPSDAYLVAYSQAFTRVMGGCRVSRDDLITIALNVSDQASYNGGRDVSLLYTLKAIARRVTWSGTRSCGYIYNIAEANLEAGNP